MLTLVFTDLVDSTPVKAALPGADLGERNRRYLDTILSPHRDRVAALRDRFGGRTVDQLGDAFFLVFSSAAAAARFAVHLHRSHADDPIPTPLGPVRVRVGMHTGEPLDDPHAPGRLVGREVDYAARLAALAEGGQVVLSEATATLLRQAMLDEARYHPHGDRDLKGIGRVPVFELLYEGRPPQPLREAALAPENLPPPPARVTGQEALLAEVRQRLHEGGVVALKGEGGMGKTTLALAAAHAAVRAGEVPGGAAWVDCEAGPDLAECARQAAAVLFGDRCEGEAPAGLGRRVLGHLSDRRGLLVLDNFETVAGDADLIRWLAAARPPARVLLTTREVPAGLAGRVVPVRELARGDACRLFLGRLTEAGVGDAPPGEVVEALCAAVGGQPLGVELLAARAARVPAPRLLDQLRRGLAVLDARGDPTRPGRHQSVRACFEGSAADLSAAARELLTGLSVAPAGYDPDVIAAVTGRDDWDDAAEELVGVSLWRLAGDRYGAHPLVRQFAAEALGAGRAAAEVGAARGLARVALARAEDAAPGPAHVARARRYLEWTAANLPNLVAALEWARGHGLWDLIPGLARATEIFWNTDGHWPVAERFGQAAVEAAGRLGRPADEAFGHDYLGSVYRHQGRDAEAEEAYRRALAVCDAHQLPPTLWARSSARLGKLYSVMCRYVEAEPLLARALAGSRAAGDRHGEATALAYTGQHAKYLSEWRRAEEVFAEALALARGLGNVPLEREIRYQLGDVRLQTGDRAAAARDLEASAALAREFGNREAEAKAVSDLGVIARQEGRLADARGHLLAALAVHQVTGFRNREGRALRRLAEVEYAAGDRPAALEYARRAVAVLTGTQAVLALRRAERVLADLEAGEDPNDTGGPPVA